jgi:hypothetical protein
MRFRTVLTIFSTPKPFKGLSAIQQTNAVESWKRLGAEVLLLDTPKYIARKLGGVKCVLSDGLRYGPGGLPLVPDLFKLAERYATHDLLVYANADIIFATNLVSAMRRVADRFDQFLMVGQRWDIELNKKLYGLNDEWLQRIIMGQGKLHSVSGKDWFAFRRPLGLEFPPFVIGRVMWDNWLLNAALEAGIPVVDATECVTAVHQEHGYPDGWLYDEGAEYNRGLCDVPPNKGRISEANWVMDREGITKRETP